MVWLSSCYWQYVQKAFFFVLFLQKATSRFLVAGISDILCRHNGSGMTGQKNRSALWVLPTYSPIIKHPNNASLKVHHSRVYCLLPPSKSQISLGGSFTSGETLHWCRIFPWVSPNFNCLRPYQITHLILILVRPNLYSLPPKILLVIDIITYLLYQYWQIADIAT